MRQDTREILAEVKYCGTGAPSWGTMRVLSIDAWADTEPRSWSWNAWYSVGTITVDEFERVTKDNSNRALLKWFRDSGYISAHSAGRVAIEDDGYNVVVIDRHTFEPLFAIEYGTIYN